MSLRPLDTTPEALERQRSALESLGPEGRLRAAIEMSESVRALRLAGLRSRDPEASERQLVERLVARVHGVRLDPPK